MKLNIENRSIVIALGLGLLVTGCAETKHYMVTDPASGKVYYTETVEQTRSGTVQLKDARSGSQVTLHSSEVKEISSEAYKSGLAAPVNPPAPAAATAPAATPAPAAQPAAPTAAPSPTPTSTK